MSLSLKFIRHNPILFIGAFITMLLASLLLSLTILGFTAALAVDDGLIAIMTLSSIMSGFISCFVMASSFNFSIALRQRELALFRLSGGTGGQLRKILVGEALVLALVASVTGSLLSLAILPLFLTAINGTNFAASNLYFPNATSSVIALAVSFIIALSLAIIGALFASVRVGSITPVAALKESNINAKTASLKRIIVGSLLVMSGITLIILTYVVPMLIVDEYSYIAAIPLSVIGTIFTAVGIVVLGVIFLPHFIGLFLLPFKKFVPSKLAASNIKSQKRRTASLVAPVIISVSIITVMALVLNGLIMGFASIYVDEPVAIDTSTIMLVLAIPAIIFTAISIVNTQIMAISSRVQDIKNMCLLGISKRQIIIMPALESLVSILVGFAIGLTIALGVGAVFATALYASFGIAPFAVPWPIIGIMAGVYLTAGILASTIATAKKLANLDQIY